MMSSCLCGFTCGSYHSLNNLRVHLIINFLHIHPGEFHNLITEIERVLFDFSDRDSLTRIRTDHSHEEVNKVLIKNRFEFFIRAVHLDSVPKFLRVREQQVVLLHWVLLER